MLERIILLACGVIVSAGLGSTSTAREAQPLRPTDERLEQLIEAALAADPHVESYEIVVTVQDGSARLNGAVDTDRERARAGSVAADVEGVVEVENRITVDEAFVSTEVSDAEVRREVLDEVADAFPEARIHVTVENGFATLTGTVSSAAIRRQMTEIAFQAGSVLVKNQIRVEPE